MEMLCGGLLLLLAGAGHRPDSRSRPKPDVHSSLSWRSAYLIVFGSLVAFTAYIWLLRVTLPSSAATNAYVNPVVAVFLGWALGGEAAYGSDPAGGGDHCRRCS